MKIYTKQEIAESQLRRSVSLLIDDNDIISAITLAGAAEEILGSLLASKGVPSLLSEMAAEFSELGRLIDQPLKASDFKYELNYFRNELKHHNKGSDPITVPTEAAKEIIVRAAENLYRLTGDWPDYIIRFESWAN